MLGSSHSVGKTAILLGLAHLSASGNAPEVLRGHRLIALSPACLGFQAPGRKDLRYSVRRADPSWSITGVTDVAAAFDGPGNFPRG